MNKLEKDGLVAVLICTSYGAGWSTANAPEHRDVLLFDADIVQAVLDGRWKEVSRLAHEKTPGCYAASAAYLEVCWVPRGAQFEITEYDGCESLHVIGSREYITA